MEGYAQRGPVIESPKPDAVKVTAAEFNGALPWDKAFDGCPFSHVPQWLDAALREQKLTPHARGGTDYAQWDLKTPGRIQTARPGDWIVRRANGDLDICEHELAKAVILSAMKLAR